MTNDIRNSEAPYRDHPVTFLFPGLGEHYVNLARELYVQEPVFRATIKRCGDFLKAHSDLDIYKLLTLSEKPIVTPPYTPTSANGTEHHGPTSMDLRSLLGRNGENKNGSSPVDERLKQTEVAQPMLFVIEYALAQVLMYWGVHPSAMLGYSLGEYVAACLSGIFSLEDALTLVSGRARLIQALPQGAMVAVALSRNDIQPYLTQHINLAAINAPFTCVLAGPIYPIDLLEKRLAEREIIYRRIEITHAFHSSMLEPLRQPLIRLTRQIHLSVPTIPSISNVTGTWITNEQATDPTYWADHMCQTVQFAAGVARLLAQPDSVLLEVGPGQALCSFVKQQPQCGHKRLSHTMPILSATCDRQSYQACLQTILGKLEAAGVTVNQSGIYHTEFSHATAPE